MSERLDTAARELLRLREAADRAKRTAEEAARQRDQAEATFWSLMDDLGLKSFTLEQPDENISFVRRSTVYHQVIDWPTLQRAVTELGLERELTAPGPRKGVLNEFVRTALEAGRELPPGLGYRDNKYVSVTRKKR